MADNDKQPSFYEPQADPVAETAQNAVDNNGTDKPKRGRPAKNAADAAVNVAIGLSADVALAPTNDAPEGETIEQAVARIGALRDKTRHEWGRFSQKLALPVRPGYHRHWFNDVAGRIDEAKASGWSHVKNPRDGTPLKRVVGTGRDNNVLWAYAMELPDVFWNEEMDLRHNAAKERIDAIKAKPFRAAPGQSQASDQGKFYNPVEESGASPIQVVKG